MRNEEKEGKSRQKSPYESGVAIQPILYLPRSRDIRTFPVFRGAAQSQLQTSSRHEGLDILEVGEFFDARTGYCDLWLSIKGAV